MNEVNFIDFVLLSWYYFKAKFTSKFYGVSMTLGLKFCRSKKDASE